MHIFLYIRKRNELFDYPSYTRDPRTRGDKDKKKIRGKVPPFLYSLFKRDILTYNRAMHVRLIDIDSACVNRLRALQPSSRS